MNESISVWVETGSSVFDNVEVRVTPLDLFFGQPPASQQGLGGFVPSVPDQPAWFLRCLDVDLCERFVRLDHASFALNGTRF